MIWCLQNSRVQSSKHKPPHIQIIKISFYAHQSRITSIYKSSCSYPEFQRSHFMQDEVSCDCNPFLLCSRCTGGSSEVRRRSTGEALQRCQLHHRASAARAAKTAKPQPPSRWTKVNIFNQWRLTSMNLQLLPPPQPLPS